MHLIDAGFGGMEINSKIIVTEKSEARHDRIRNCCVYLCADIPTEKKAVYWVWVLGDAQALTQNQNQFGFRFRILWNLANV